MNVMWDELDAYGLSGRLWKKFAPPVNGTFPCTASGNPAIGFFDDFFNFQASTLEGPYLILETATCTVEQVACTGRAATTALGQLKFAGVGDTADDEMVLQWGRGLCAPFKLADDDLAFEARLTGSAWTADKWSVGLGLGEIGMGATDCFFIDAASDSALADKNFCGFVHLHAESTAIDAAFKADTETYQDGATKTKLNAVHTMVASTFVKLGFRYQAHPRRLEFYVNGELANPGSSSEPSLTTAELNADTFPDDVFVTPIIGAKDHAGDEAFDMHLDWWACAQAKG